MLNIDFSFIKSHELDSSDDNIGTKYNELYKNKIISNIKELDKQNLCDICDIDLSTTTDIDLRNIIEVNCKGTLGRHFCHISNSINGDQLDNGELVIIQLPEGTEVATILEFGEMVTLKRRKLGLCGEEIPEVLRLAKDSDIEQYNTNIEKEKGQWNLFLCNSNICKGTSKTQPMNEPKSESNYPWETIAKTK